MKRTIGLAIIAKNESHRIAKCLNSAKPYVDDMVVVDTGSTDNTLEVAESCGARVFKSEKFTSETKREDFDFAAARNESFEKVKADYILWMDCDDFLPSHCGQIMRSRMDEGCNDEMILGYYHYAIAPDGTVMSAFLRERIVKNHHRWVYPIHEYIPLSTNPQPMIWNDFYIEHHRHDLDPEKLFTRNISILVKHLEEKPLDARLLYYASKEYFDFGKFEECFPLLDRHVKADYDPELINCSYIRMAICHQRKGNDLEFVSSLNKAVESCPYRIDAYIMLSDYYAKNNPGLAIYWASKASELQFKSMQPDNPHAYIFEAHKRLSSLYEKIGNKEKAKFHRREWLKKDGSNISLHIGCGGQSYKHLGYRDCDIVDLPHVDHVFSMDQVPFPDCSIHRIISEHSLEHISRQKAETALREWHRVMKLGAELILKVPDLEECCRLYVDAVRRGDKESEEWYHKTIYGAQTDENDVPADYQFHLTGWSLNRLRSILEETGFVIDYIERYDGYGTPSIATRAIKSRREWTVKWHTSAESTWGPHRIRLKNVDRALRVYGFKSKLGFDHSDISVISHPGTPEIYANARNNSKIVIFDLHEDVTKIQQGFTDVLKSVDAIVCCSHKMMEVASQYNPNCFVIEDAIETPETIQCSYENNGQLKAVWAGYGGGVDLLKKIKPTIEKHGYQTVTIHEHDSADIKWNEQTWPNDMAACDIAIVTTDDSKHPAKSHIRVAAAMALGLPVICQPRDAFSRIIKNGENGFIAHSEEELEKALEILKNPEERKRIGQAGCQTAQQFRFEPTAYKWSQVIDLLFNAYNDNNPASPKKEVEIIVDDSTEQKDISGLRTSSVTDIIIPSYKNLKYLKKTVDSVRRNTEDGSYRLIVADGQSDQELVDWLKDQEDVISIFGDRMTFAQATNLGLKHSENDVCFLNNDVIVRPGWLSSMKSKWKDGIGAVGPFSNCDIGFRHGELAKTGNVDWTVNRNLEEFSEEDLESIYSAPILNKPMNDELVEWLPFYCTLVKKEVADQVGLLDENFRNGGEDYDYSMKVKELGYKMLIDRGSEVWHFGGKTRKVHSGELGEAYKKEDQANWDLQNKIWNAKRVVIYCGQGWEYWSPESINKGGIGGSETAAVMVAKEFKKMGYIVTVLGEATGIFDGVIYRHHSHMYEVMDKGADIFVSSRRMDVINDFVRSKARKILVWIHDIWLSQEKKPQGWRWELVDYYLTLSEWHRDFVIEHHEVDPEKVVMTRNGLDISRFEDKGIKRVPGRMVYSSSLDRGFLSLVQMMPRIREKVPEAHLHVCYGMDSWKKAAAYRNNPQELWQIEQTEKAIQENDWITYHGRIGQQELADLYASAMVWGYNSWFAETFCVTAIEAMASGVPVVASNFAGLKTTVGEHGFLLDGHPQYNGDLGSPEFQKQFVDIIAMLLTDKNLWNTKSKLSRQCANTLTWDEVAHDWAALCKSVPN